MFDKLGERIILKMRVINIYIEDWNKSTERFNKSREYNKFDYELTGMLDAIEELDVDYELHYTDSIEFSGITIAGRYYPV